MIISKKRLTHSWLFSGVLFSLLLSACNQSAETSRSHQQRQQPVHRVDVVTAEKKAVSLTQTVSGTLEAITRIRLYNEESARIVTLPYHEGDAVKKGSLLVQLDNALLKTDLAKAKAAKEQAKVDLSRLKKLLPKKISTEEEVAKASTQLDLAIAEELRQQIRLQRTRIKAPINGVISQRLYEPGDMLPAQSHIYTLIDPSTLRLKASLAERWIPLVTKGQRVALRIDALGEHKFTATIARIHPTINASTHKGIIEILLDPVPEGAAVGQFARAEIELRATNRLIIPVHTIHYEPEGAYVFRVMSNEKGETVAEKTTIEQGQQFDSMAEILSGLKPGDRIVSRGSLGLRTGKKIVVANATAQHNKAADHFDSTNDTKANNKK